MQKFIMQRSVQLDLESGTICRRTSDSQTCHTVVSDSCWRLFIWSVGPKHSVNSSFNCASEILLLTSSQLKGSTSSAAKTSIICCYHYHLHKCRSSSVIWRRRSIIRSQSPIVSIIIILLTSCLRIRLTAKHSNSFTHSQRTTNHLVPSENKYTGWLTC